MTRDQDEYSPSANENRGLLLLVLVALIAGGLDRPGRRGLPDIA